MGRIKDEPATYQAEQEHFLRLAREQGLLSAADAVRLRAAYSACMRREDLAPASLLPRLLLDAEDGVVLDSLARPECANERWTLYELIREQTQGAALIEAA